jgi:hypothetical protein
MIETETYVEPLIFMVQYKNAYGALHNEAIIAKDIDSAWTLALNLIGYESRIQQIWQVKP